MFRFTAGKMKGRHPIPVMTGYSLTLAAFLLIGGSLGDRFGRRKVYLIGIVWFALASAACGFAPTALFLIVTRLQPSPATSITRAPRPQSCS